MSKNLHLFRYPGGKSRASVRKQILPYKPDKIKEYREPFVGGGGIFFAIPTTVTRWINDINDDLISVYKALRDRPDDFIRDCRNIEPERPGELEISTKTENGAKYNARLGAVFSKFAQDPSMDPALRYFFINRTVWAGRVNYDEAKASRMYYSNPSGWNIVEKPNLLENVSKHLQGVTITSISYERLFLQDGQDVWVYADPPYYRDTELKATDKQYAFGFSIKDHYKFADTVKNSKHKFCISYDDHPVIRDLFKDFNIYSHSWAYSGTTQEKKTIGKELIITNYEKPGKQLELGQEYEDILKDTSLAM